MVQERADCNSAVGLLRGISFSILLAAVIPKPKIPDKNAEMIE